MNTLSRLSLTLFLLLLPGFSGGQSVVRNLAGGCGIFSTEAQAALDEYSNLSLMSCSFQQAIADFVDECVSDGNWDERQQLLVAMVESVAGGNHLTDISGFNHDASVNGSVTVGHTEGWQFDGTDDEYVSSGFTPSTDHDDLADDDAAYILFVNVADPSTSGTVYYVGARDSQSPNKSWVALFDTDATTGDLRGYIHDDGGHVTAANTAVVDDTFYSVSRDGTSNEAKLWTDAVNTVTNSSSNPLGGLLEREIVIGATDTEGSILFECDCTIGIWAVFKMSTLNFSELIGALQQLVIDIDAI